MTYPTNWGPGIPPHAPKRERRLVLAHYGGACVWCGSRVQLELDHVANDGQMHRRMLKAADLSIEEWLIAHDYPSGVIRLLCRPCHELKTYGTVRPQAALRRFAWFLTHTKEGRMPPRKGATPVHLTLSAEAADQLERLAALAPGQNKSLVVQGLILRTITDHGSEVNGHFADILASVEKRLTLVPEAVAGQLTQIASTAQTVTGALMTRHQTFERIEARLSVMEAILREAFPTPKELAERRRGSRPLAWWRRVLIRCLGGAF